MNQVISQNAKNYFLELVRSLAAIYVVFYHIHQKINFGKAGDILFNFGQEAVMIFFVLSGFVILYSVENKAKELTPLKYFKARFLRIYPVFIISCIIAYACNCIIYNAWVSIKITQFLSNVCMLQDFYSGKPGIHVTPYMGNLPLWSLSYEWWFYMFFLVLFFYIKSNKAYIYVCIISCIGLITYLYYPNQISLWFMYFILWWLGAEVAKKYVNVSHNPRNLYVTFLTAVLMLIILILFAMYYKKDHALIFGFFPVLFIRHFFAAILFAAFLWSVDVQKIKVSSTNFLAWLAPYTYAIYIFHYPLLNLFNSKNWLNGISGILLFLMVVFILSYITEKYIQKKIVSWFR